MSDSLPLDIDNIRINAETQALIIDASQERDIEVEPRLAIGLFRFLRASTLPLRGPLPLSAATELVYDVAECDQIQPLYSSRGFRYPPVPNIEKLGIECTAKNTVVAARDNLHFFKDNYGLLAFGALRRDRRRNRLVEWAGTLDGDYELRVRGGSGAGAFSIDVGMGILDHTKRIPVYKELWRSGVDTVKNKDTLGARFIRTGTGVKVDDKFKQEAFDRFRREYGVMPQRLLALLGLYVMRELKPDYAVSLSTHGAIRYSTLGKSHGNCDYDGIFGGVGFLPSEDPHWFWIPNFDTGFYEAIDRANLNSAEIKTLDRAIEVINQAKPISKRPELLEGRNLTPLVKLCCDTSPATVEREMRVFLPKVSRPH